MAADAIEHKFRELFWRGGVLGMFGEDLRLNVEIERPRELSAKTS